MVEYSCSTADATVLLAKTLFVFNKIVPDCRSSKASGVCCEELQIERSVVCYYIAGLRLPFI